MNTTEIIKKVRKIEIKTKGLSNQIFSGSYHSAFKGRGMTFSEIREYAYGDDVRNIDWNVTAKYKAPFIKVFSEERELTLMLIVDISNSIFFGLKTRTKNEWMTEISAVLSFSAIKNNDKVGLILFSDQVEMYIPPKKGKGHILRIIRELINTEGKSTVSDPGVALTFLNNVMKRRCITFLLSDFLTTDSFKSPLSICRAKHDIIGIKVFDKIDTALPDVGLVRGYDLGTKNTMWIDTSDRNTRKNYADYYQKCTENFKQTFIKTGLDYLEIDSSENYIKPLQSFFKQRSKRK